MKLYRVYDSRTGATDILQVNDVSEISLMKWTDIKFLRLID